MKKISIINRKYKISLLLSSLLFPLATLAAGNTTNVKIGGNLIMNPPCELTSVDSGEVIEVDFGDLVIRKMDTTIQGRTYKQRLPYKLVCDAPKGTGVNFLLTSEKKASFNNDLVGTTNKNVGILFLNAGNLFSPSGSPAGMKVGSESVLEIVPIRNGDKSVKIDAGDFSATATLTAVYQ